MLCPKVNKFPIPKTSSFINRNVGCDELKRNITNNDLYESVFITIPDEIFVPNGIEELLSVDRQYYKLTDCPATIFLADEFIDKFVKTGSLRCLSVGRCSATDNCVAVSKDQLALQVGEHDYRCLGIEGTKRNNNYQIRIQLKQKLHPRLTECINKLGTFNFNVTWEPDDDSVCPSSIAKYLFERNVRISAHNPHIKHLDCPSVSGIPSPAQAEPSQVLEWMGMLWHGCDLTPEHLYVSTYAAPESSLHTTRLAMSSATGCFTPGVIMQLCDALTEYVSTKHTPNYWCSVTAQTFRDAHFGRLGQFQVQNSSVSVFVCQDATVLCTQQLMLL